MATPAQYVYTDPTVGLELTTGDEVALEATRWLFLAGDLLDPQRKDELPHLQRGGEELDNRCLRRTNGYLPRCTFTPMETWAEWLPIEFFPEGVRPLSLKGAPQADTNPTGRTLVGKPLYGFPHYPGELIVDALGIATGEKRGTVEIEVLRNVDVGDSAALALENLFWPADYHPPIELRVVEEHIQRVAEANHASEVQLAARDMLRGCEQFRRWAQQQIDKAHTQLDARVAHEWTYSYSAKVRSLLKQLEMPARNVAYSPVDSLISAMKDQGLTPNTFSQLASRDEQLVEKLGAMFSAVLAEALKGTQEPKSPKAGK